MTEKATEETMIRIRKALLSGWLKKGTAIMIIPPTRNHELCFFKQAINVLTQQIDVPIW